MMHLTKQAAKSSGFFDESIIISLNSAFSAHFSIMQSSQFSFPIFKLILQDGDLLLDDGLVEQLQLLFVDLSAQVRH